MNCALCGTAAVLPAGWREAQLAERLILRTVFTAQPGPAPEPGVYPLCPTCVDWLPDARSGALPAAVQAFVDSSVASVELHPRTRRQLRADLVGIVRHFAAHLKLGHPGGHRQEGAP